MSLVADSPGKELLKALTGSVIHPNHVITVRKWKKEHEKSINEKIRRNITTRRKLVYSKREAEERRNRKIQLDELARSWLENIGQTEELRVYLIDKCLPSLILALESLLVKTNDIDDSFNPINYLAQKLMRNNPRYCSRNANHPYTRGLNQVKEELKQLVPSLRYTEAARITSEARRRRYERLRLQALTEEEEERRSEIVMSTFEEWNFTNPTIPMYKIQRAMRSFVEERVPEFNPEMQEVCKFHDDVEPDRKDPLSKEAYTEFVLKHIKGWPIGAFNAFISHIGVCALAVPLGDQRKKIQSSLTSLFRAIDKGREDSLDRHHILSLIKLFYQKLPLNMKKYINNPLEWSERDTLYSPDETVALTLRVSTLGGRLTEEDRTGEPPEEDQTQKIRSQQEQKTPKSDEKSIHTDNDDGEIRRESHEKTEDAGETLQDASDIALDIQEKVNSGASIQGASEIAPGVKERNETMEHKRGVPDKTEDAMETLQDASDIAPDVEVKPNFEELAQESKEGAKSSLNKQPEPEIVGASREDEQVIEDDSNPEDVKSKSKTEPFGLKPEFNKASMEEGKAVTTTKREAESEPEKKSTKPHNVEELAVEFVSPLAQERALEIDPRLPVDEFVYVTEKLLGEDPHPRALTALSEFLEDSFRETPQQRQVRQLQEKLSLRRHLLMSRINDLFDQWDSDHLGFLDKTEILTVLSQWQKNSTKQYNIDMAQQICSAVENTKEHNLLREDFVELCKGFHQTLESDDYMDRLLDFVFLVLKTQKYDLKRERRRRRWIEVMSLLPKISAFEHQLYFQGFFDIIKKDFAHHGDGRMINAYIALVEPDPDAVEDEGDDPNLLRYVACTEEDEGVLLGKCLYGNQKSISNQVRKTGKAVYITQIRNNSHVHLWAMDKWAVDEERDGAFLVLPIKLGGSGKVVGVVGVDTLQSSINTQLLPHELTFIRELVNKLSEGFSYLDARHKFQRSLVSLLHVISRKDSTVRAGSCYVVEPIPHVQSGPFTDQDNSPTEKHVLRNIMKLLNGRVKQLEGSERAVLRHSDSCFRYSVSDILEHANLDGKRDYLFSCLLEGNEVQTRAYGNNHTAITIFTTSGDPFLLLDLDTGPDDEKILSTEQISSIHAIIDKLMGVFDEVCVEASEGKHTFRSDTEKNLPDELRFALRFENAVLMELKKQMSNMDLMALSEIRSYNEPPPIIATVIQVVLEVLGLCSQEELQEWNRMKSYVNGDLLKRLSAFDPLTTPAATDIHKISDKLKGIAAEDVLKGGSLPTFVLYQWVMDVLSILRVGEPHVSQASGSGRSTEKKTTYSIKPTLSSIQE